MPWYWTDELAAALVSAGSIDTDAAAEMISLPVAYRSDHETLEEAARELAEDGEIPLAA